MNPWTTPLPDKSSFLITKTLLSKWVYLTNSVLKTKSIWTTEVSYPKTTSITTFSNIKLKATFLVFKREMSQLVRKEMREKVEVSLSPSLHPVMALFITYSNPIRKLFKSCRTSWTTSNTMAMQEFSSLWMLLKTWIVSSWTVLLFQQNLY